MPFSKPLALAVLLTLLSSGNAPAQLNLELPDMNLPDMGSPASAALSTREEYELGKQLVRELRRSRPIIEDPELNDWIRALGNRLALHSPNRNGSLYVLIENNPDINAHTLAGGVIVINSGLILNTQSESELAAVMAHEIAHVSQRHIARMLAESKTNPLLTGLGILAGAAVASQSADAAQAIITGTMALQAHQKIVFSQKAESEADRVGLRILASAGFSPEAMPFFLEKLDRSQSSLYGDIGKYLNTHPLTIERLSDTRSRAYQLGKRTPQEHISYLFARAKLQQLTRQHSNPGSQTAPLLDKYTQAARFEQAGNPAAVLQTLGLRSSQLPIALMIGRALNHLRRYSEAEQLLAPLQQRYPGQEALTTTLASALAGNQKLLPALQVITRQKTSESSSIEFFETAQRIAQQAGQAAEASLFNAERSIRTGEYRHAKATLEQALKSPDMTAQTQAAIRNRLMELEKMQNLQKQFMNK